MRVRELLHKIVKNGMHKCRKAALFDVVETVVHSKSLSLTSVGRKLQNGNQTRSNIRKVDRLYGNVHLQRESLEIYGCIIKHLVKTHQPIVLIDDTKLPRSNYSSLRLSLASSGRSLTLYEIVYNKKKSKGYVRRVYKELLDNFESMLPANCKPIFVSDAAFSEPFFKQLYIKGWGFVGRVRGLKNIKIGGGCFVRLKTLYKKATTKPMHLGQGFLNKKQEHTIAGDFYLYKKLSKGRKAYTRSGRHSETDRSLRCAKSAKEPWVLFSSIDNISANEIIKIYECRMQIEENFRDNKSVRYGLGLEHAKSKIRERHVVMLLLAALATLVAYLIGAAGEAKNLHYQFQANSIKTKRVISRFFLGCEMIYRKISIPIKDVDKIPHLLFNELGIKLT